MKANKNIYRTQHSYCSGKSSHSHSRQNLLTGFADLLVHELRTGKRKHTADTCKAAVRSILAFTGNKNLLLEDFSPALMESYENHLLQRGLCPNSISFYMRNLRAILNKAIDRNLMLPPYENPFAHVHTGIYETRKRALTADELHALTGLCAKKTLSTKMQHALKYFLFGFHAAGMSFIDMAFLKKTDIRGNHIYYYRRKTKQLISVWISQPMRDIINDFMSITRPDSPYVFPIIDPDEDDDEMQQYETALRLQNRRLKKLGEEAGIEKKLTTHAARHSWATVARRENISVSVISNCLGHKNETVTGVYLGAVDTGVKDEAIQHVSSLFPMNYRIYGEEETGHKKSPSPDKRRTLWNSESTAKVESIAKMKNYSGR